MWQVTMWQKTVQLWTKMPKENCLADVVKYGVYHTPKQFLSRAHQVQHPMDSTDHLESVTKSALDFIFQYPFSCGEA